MKIMVLALNQYKFNNSDTGEIVEGVTMEYLSDTPVADDNKKGYFPLKQSIDSASLQDITSVPGIYEVNLSMSSGKNRKANVVFSGFNLVNEVDLKEFFKCV